MHWARLSRLAARRGDGGEVVTHAEVVQAYGSAWNETDEAARRRLLDVSWADGAVYCDPTGRAEGRDGLSEHISAFQRNMPNHRIDLVTSVDEHDGLHPFWLGDA